MKKTLALALALLLVAAMSIPAIAEEELTDAYKLTDEPVTITLVRSDNSNQPMLADTLVEQYIEKYTGVNLEIEAVAGSDFTTKTEIMIASDNMPDIMYDCYYVDTYASTGIFLNFADYLDIMPNISALFEQYPDLKNLYIDGALYEIPVLGYEVYRMGRSAMIRQDLFEETGMAAPTTWDELYDVLLAIKENHPDIYPIGNRNNTANLFTCYAYPFGTGDGVYYEPTLGEYVYGQMSEEFITLLQWLANAYADGLLDPDYAVCTSTQWQERLASGANCFFFDNPSFAVNFNAALAVDNPEAQFAPMETPAQGETRRSQYYNKHDLGATVVYADTEYPEIVCGLIDFLYSDVGRDLTNWGLEGQQYEVLEDGSKALLPEVIAEFAEASDPIRAFYGSIGGGKLGLARYIDEYANDAFMDAMTASWYEMWGSWEFMDEPVIDPSFTADESEELAELKTNVDTVLTAAYDAFIMGERPVEEFTEVQAEIADDCARICEIYNTAANR